MAFNLKKTLSSDRSSKKAQQMGDKRMDHNAYPESLKHKSEETIRYIMQDCKKALDAMPNNPNAGYYQDEINYCINELARRKREGHDVKSAAADAQLQYNKQLDKNRQEFSQKAPDEGNTELQLKHNFRKDKDTTTPFNSQLSEARTGTNNAITDKAMDENPDVYSSKRSDKASKMPILPVNLMGAAKDEEKAKAIKAEEDKQKRESGPWKENVGDQMIGKKTTITKNDQKSQLANHKDRLKGLSKTMPTSQDHQENKNRMNKKDKIENLVMASLQDVDKMIFHLYATAAKEDRNLGKNESQMLTDLNSSKARLLHKLAQFSTMPMMDEMEEEDDFMLNEEPSFEDVDPSMEENMDTVIEDEPTYVIQEGSGPLSGHYIVLEQEFTEDGESKKSYVHSFPSAEEAQSAFPDAVME